MNGRSALRSGDRLAGVISCYEHEVAAHLTRLGEDSEADGTRVTIATNSSLIETRGRPLVQLALRELRRDDLSGLSVLDLGCGYGGLSALFATEGATVVGIDSSFERLKIGNQIAQQHELDVALRIGRLERPEVAHAGFDLVLINNSLCYVVPGDARQRSLEEAYRALRPNGVIIVHDPNRLHPRDNFTGLMLIGVLPPRLASAAARALARSRSAVRLRSPRGARRELEECGFVAVRSVTAGGRLREMLGGYNTIVARRPLS